MRGDLTQNPESPRLVRPSLVFTGEIDALASTPNRVLGSVGHPIRLAQVDSREGMSPPVSHRDGPLDRLLKKRQAVGNTSGQDIRIAKKRRDGEEPSRDAPGLAELLAALEERDALVGISLRREGRPGTGKRADTAKRGIPHPGNWHRFLSPG